jgi:segregation and condensation protein B
MAENDELLSGPAQEDGISLDELAQAFAQVMGTAPKQNPEFGADIGATTPPAETDAAAEPSAATPDAPTSHAASDGQADSDTCPITPQTILEAMLFVGDRENRSLSSAKVAELLRGVESAEVPGLIDELNRRYAAHGCPYEIIHEGDGYRMVLGKPFHGLRDRFYGRVRDARLSQAAIDILAIVAYEQPLTAEQVNAMRGKPGGHVLSQLVRRGLLRIERQPGKRTAQYFTTDRFLQLFNLETLADLPQSEELERQ